MNCDDRAPSRSEQRAFPRYAFSAMQEIARMVNDRIPPRDEFEKVRCVDISRSGFSFYRPSPTEGDSLVVALGDRPPFIYFAAQVVNCEKVDHGDQVVYRIGCQFTGRVKLEDAVAFEQMDDAETAFLLLSGGGGG